MAGRDLFLSLFFEICDKKQCCGRKGGCSARSRIWLALIRTLTWLGDPHGIALNAENRVAFMAGQGNHKLVVVDLKNIQAGPPLSVGRNPDILSFDNGTKRLFVAAESGQVKVFHEANRTLEPEGELHLPHGHTVALDSKTHLVYFPLEDLDGKPVLRVKEWVGSRRTGD